MNRSSTSEAVAGPKPLRIDQEVLAYLMVGLLRIAFRLYGRWKVIGVENIPRTGPVLFAANHSSDLDPLLAWVSTYHSRRMWGVAKAELWKGRIAPYLLTCIKAIPVRRGAPDRAMIRRVLELLSQGEAVGIFPEGTRSRTGLLQPAHPGLALFVQKSGAPVLPVAMIGAYAMLPPGAKRLRRVPLKVVFGKPMTFAPDCPREEILTSVMAAIAALMTANGQPTEPPAPPVPAAMHLS